MGSAESKALACCIDEREFQQRMSLLASTDIFLRYLGIDISHMLGRRVDARTFWAGEEVLEQLLPPGQKVTAKHMREGFAGSCLYYVAEGELTIIGDVEGEPMRGQRVVEDGYYVAPKTTNTMELGKHGPGTFFMHSSLPDGSHLPRMRVSSEEDALVLAFAPAQMRRYVAECRKRVRCFERVCRCCRHTAVVCGCARRDGVDRFVEHLITANVPLTLARLPMFHDLAVANPAWLCLLASVCELEVVPAGRALAEQGEHGTAMYVLMHGRMTVQSRIGRRAAHQRSRVLDIMDREINASTQFVPPAKVRDHHVPEVATIGEHGHDLLLQHSETFYADALGNAACFRDGDRPILPSPWRGNGQPPVPPPVPAMTPVGHDPVSNPKGLIQSSPMVVGLVSAHHAGRPRHHHKQGRRRRRRRRGSRSRRQSQGGDSDDEDEYSDDDDDVDSDEGYAAGEGKETPPYALLSSPSSSLVKGTPDSPQKAGAASRAASNDLGSSSASSSSPSDHLHGHELVNHHSPSAIAARLHLKQATAGLRKAKWATDETKIAAAVAMGVSKSSFSTSLNVRIVPDANQVDAIVQEALPLPEGYAFEPQQINADDPMRSMSSSRRGRGRGGGGRRDRQFGFHARSGSLPSLRRAHSMVGGGRGGRPGLGQFAGDGYDDSVFRRNANAPDLLRNFRDRWARTAAEAADPTTATGKKRVYRRERKRAQQVLKHAKGPPLKVGGAVGARRKMRLGQGLKRSHSEGDILGGNGRRSPPSFTTGSTGRSAPGMSLAPTRPDTHLNKFRRGETNHSHKSLRLSVSDGPVDVARLKRGAYFGVSSLLGTEYSRFNSTITADVECVVLRLDKADYKRVSWLVPGMRSAMYAYEREHRADLLTYKTRHTQYLEVESPVVEASVRKIERANVPETCAALRDWRTRRGDGGSGKQVFGSAVVSPASPKRRQ